MLLALLALLLLLNDLRHKTILFVPALQRPEILSAGVFVMAQVRACLEQWPRRQGGGDGHLVADRGLCVSTHVHPPAPSPVPGPPGPPPTPPSPPAPPPTGWKWTCFSDKGYNPAEAGLQDKQRGEADFTACEQTCNGAMGCVALRYHESSKHCHLSIGPPLTLAEFRKLLKPQAAYSSCIMLKQ